MNNVKEIDVRTFCNPPMAIVDNLYSSLSVPSGIHAYSLAMEYMRNWFMSKFNDNYFKRLFIDGRDMVHEFRNFKINESLKVMKPALAISQQISFDHNRDNLDNYMYGTNLYSRRSVFERAFFKDFKNNIFLSLNLDELESSFNFKVKVATRAQQVDLYRYMKLSCRVGATMGENVNIDCHIPYELMLQLANDAAFEIKDDKIVNVLGFTAYLNKHSIIPVLYKYRTINNKGEFFLRLSDMYVHISNLDQLSVDDGEKEGMVNNNFIVEMNSVLHMPAPKMYIYHSEKEHKLLVNQETSKKDEDIMGLFSVQFPKIPNTDEHDWNLYTVAESEEESLKDCVNIQLTELFKNSEIEKVIKITKDMYLSPSLFINFKLYNNSKEIKFDMDWNTLTATTDKPQESLVTDVAIYIDLKYVNEQLINLGKFKDSRIK